MDAGEAGLVGGALALGTLGPLGSLALGGWTPRPAGRLASMAGLATGLGMLASLMPVVAGQPALLWASVVGATSLSFVVSQRAVPEGKLWWALCLLFAVLVGTLSGQAGGAGHLRGVLSSVFALTGTGLDSAVLVVRKSVHLVAYGAFAWAAGRVALEGGKGRAWAALPWVVALAGLDELRQSVTPGRTGLGSDVLVDLVGATVAVVALHRMLNRSPQPEASGGLE